MTPSIARFGKCTASIEQSTIPQRHAARLARNVQTIAAPLLSRQWCTHSVQWCTPRVAGSGIGSFHGRAALLIHPSVCVVCCAVLRRRIHNPDVHTIAAPHAMVHSDAMVHTRGHRIGFRQLAATLSGRITSPCLLPPLWILGRTETRGTYAYARMQRMHMCIGQAVRELL